MQNSFLSPEAPLGRIITPGRVLLPGVLVSLTVGLAAMFISDHYGGPVMLYALLLGMALNFLGDGGAAKVGVQFVSKSVLRFGVALLGARITIDHLLTLGVGPIVMVISGVALTIGTGWLLSKAVGLRWDMGVLTGGAVAICGASAALAISAVLPKNEDSERNTVLAVVGVTTLSTIAMIVYPLISQLLGFNDVDAGTFIGGTIHDVAQVVGAGYMISDTAGEYATFVKLMRVIMLVPVVLGLSLLLRNSRTAGEKKPALLPLFLIAFVVLVIVNSLGVVPTALQQTLTELSSFFLVTAIAALGMKTSLGRLAVVGWKPVALLVIETLVLAAFVIGVLTLL